MIRDREGYSYPQLEEKLPYEPRFVLNTIRDWVSKEALNLIRDCYDEKRFPMELIPEMAERGFFGVKTDPKYGGHGADNFFYGAVCLGTEFGDSGLRSCISVQNSLVMFPLEEFGSKEQRERWLPQLVKGEVMGAFGLTDEGSGSDPESMHSYLRHDGADFILNGSKRFITNGSIAAILIVWAKLDGMVRGLILEKGMCGFEAVPLKRKGGMCASDTAQLFFNDVRIPGENILPGTMERKRAYIPCLAEARSGIAWGVVGAASYCAEKALEYLRDRKLLHKQLIQEDLANMDSAIYAAKLRALNLAERKDANEQTVMDVSRSKRDNVRMACDVARTARRLMGGDGMMHEYDAIRHMCNLEAVYTYEGTDHIHTLILGREITGRNAF